MSAWRSGDRLAVRATTIVWVLAVGFRVALALVNGDANDNHMPVIQVIAYQHRIPADSELWEAHQPKLYHATVALALRALPVMPDWAQARVAQGFSCAAGVATLMLMLAFLRSLEISERARLTTFALVALNPKMIAASVTATNDAFVILCVSTAIFFGYRFYRDASVRSFLGMTAGAVLSGLAKGNGLVVAIAIVLVFAVLIVRPPRDRAFGDRRRTLAFALAFLVTYAATVPALGGYWSRYERAGTYIPHPRATFGAPHFITWSYVPKPGVHSVLDAYFTFRLIDMLRDPMITHGEEDYPRHRTSVWSLLYGDLHSGHYYAWPTSWASRTKPVQWLGRVIFLVALIPTAVLVMGFLRELWTTGRWVTSRASSAVPIERLYLALTAAGYIAFILLYAYRERGYDAVKIIFIAPAALAFASYGAFELDRVAGAVRPSVRRLVFASCAALWCAYVIDVSVLLEQLIALHLPRL